VWRDWEESGIVAVLSAGAANSIVVAAEESGIVVVLSAGVANSIVVAAKETGIVVVLSAGAANSIVVVAKETGIVVLAAAEAGSFSGRNTALGSALRLRRGNVVDSASWGRWEGMWWSLLPRPCVSYSWNWSP
jgi:adenosylcobinamide amidohydrolase